MQQPLFFFSLSLSISLSLSLSLSLSPSLSLSLALSPALSSKVESWSVSALQTHFCFIRWFCLMLFRVWAVRWE